MNLSKGFYIFLKSKGALKGAVLPPLKGAPFIFWVIGAPAKKPFWLSVLSS